MNVTGIPGSPWVCNHHRLRVIQSLNPRRVYHSVLLPPYTTREDEYLWVPDSSFGNDPMRFDTKPTSNRDVFEYHFILTVTFLQPSTLEIVHPGSPSVNPVPTPREYLSNHHPHSLKLERVLA